MITRVGIQCEEKGKVNTVSVLRLVSIYSFTLRIRKFGNFIPVRWGKVGNNPFKYKS